MEGNGDMRHEFLKKLEKLSYETDLSLAEVIRRSLAVYDLIW